MVERRLHTPEGSGSIPFPASLQLHHGQHSDVVTSCGLVSPGQTSGGRMRTNHKLSTTARGLGWRWQQARRLALERDCGLCQVCARAGRITQTNEVDHIIPRAKGGADELGNLQSICGPCHERKTAADEGWRMRVRIGADGWPTE